MSAAFASGQCACCCCLSATSVRWHTHTYVRGACTLRTPFTVQALAVARAHSRRIKYVIVIMMENRSFIHMLGNLNKLNPEVRCALHTDVPGRANVVP